MGISARGAHSTHNRRARTSAIAAAAVLSMMAMPAPATAGGPTRTVLLTAAESAPLSTLAAQVGALGGRVLASLDLADTLLVELPTRAAAPAGSRIVPDIAMHVNAVRMVDAPTVPTYLETIGAGGAATGRGVRVALVDTGVADLPDLLPNVEHINVSGDVAGDGLGHGTFTAGLIAGHGPFPGVAPEATIIDVKVADNEGATTLSKVLAGLQAVKGRDVDVLNISLSTGSPLPPAFDPLTRALDRLWHSGVTVVAAAGNDGPDWGTVSSPATDPLLLAVGSVDEKGTASRRDDVVADFSARGTTVDRTKPDLVAPGRSLIAPAAPGSTAVLENPTSLVGAAHLRGSGTSFSAGVLSGAVAAVLSVNPRLTPDGVKDLVTSTAYSSKDLRRADGAGQGALDLAAAVAAAPSAPVTGRADSSAASGDWGPSEDDADAWDAFADAWADGDLAAAKTAWATLSWQTQQWAARSWSMAVVVDSLDESKPEFEARSWSARSWSLDEWLARSWSARSWSARSWSYETWLARSWSARSWSARSWSARSWSAVEWLSRSWSARSWSSADWAARSWSARSWSARSWSARSWSDLVWEARSWSARSWNAHSWSMIL